MKHRGCSLVLTFTLIVIQVPLSAQEYFDQNRVRYRTVDFKILKTQHFDIYSTMRKRQLQKTLRACQDVRTLVRTSFENIEAPAFLTATTVIYANHADFEAQR